MIHRWKMNVDLSEIWTIDLWKIRPLLYRLSHEKEFSTRLIVLFIWVTLLPYFFSFNSNFMIFSLEMEKNRFGNISSIMNEYSLNHSSLVSESLMKSKVHSSNLSMSFSFFMINAPFKTNNSNLLKKIVKTGSFEKK